jgi:hypothetical protein
VGLARVFDPLASAREHLHEPGDDGPQQCVQFLVGRRAGLDEAGRPEVAGVRAANCAVRVETRAERGQIHVGAWVRTRKQVLFPHSCLSCCAAVSAELARRWAQPFKREFDVSVQQGSNCGAGGLKVAAAFLERPVIQKMLDRLELDPRQEPREPGRRFTA